MAINCAKDNGKWQCKIFYKLFKEEDEYDTSIEIYLSPTLSQLKEFLCGIHHCVTVVVK